MWNSNLVLAASNVCSDCDEGAVSVESSEESSAMVDVDASSEACSPKAALLQAPSEPRQDLWTRRALLCGIDADICKRLVFTQVPPLVFFVLMTLNVCVVLSAGESHDTAAEGPWGRWRWRKRRFSDLIQDLGVGVVMEEVGEEGVDGGGGGGG